MSVPARKLTLDEYLDWESQQPDKNEYFRGEVFAMVGARRVHGRIVANLSRAIGNHLAGGPCQVFTEGMKVQIGQDIVFYPDLLVTCDKDDLATEMIFRAPRLVIEVLSPSTQNYDRGLKFAAYRRLTSLQEFVLIDPDSRQVEVSRRTDRNQWLLTGTTSFIEPPEGTNCHATPATRTFLPTALGGNRTVRATLVNAFGVWPIYVTRTQAESNDP